MNDMVLLMQEKFEDIIEGLVSSDNRDSLNTDLSAVDAIDISCMTEDDVEAIENSALKYINSESALAVIYAYSILVGVVQKKKYVDDFMKYITKSNIGYELKYALYKQLCNAFFREPKLTPDFSISLELLKNIVDMAAGQLQEGVLAPIPYEERNHGLVIVIISQLLGDTHGPTKHAVDHCLAIKNGLHKNVLLINTAEMGKGIYGYIPFYQYRNFNYIDEYSELDSFTWKNASIPFFQCSNDMPNTQEIEMLLNVIKKYKPEFVLEIGCGSIVASLAEKIVPVLTNSTMHSLVEVSVTKYQTLARLVTDKEKAMLEAVGKSGDDFIFSMFTSAVRERSSIVTRESMKIPEDAFAVAVVGTRLGSEITPEIMTSLGETIRENSSIYYVFFGIFDGFENRVSELDEELQAHMIFYGFTKDTISCLDNCDAFFNPPRVGGGMSAIEAMFAGLPAVSTSFGDGGVVLGSDFWVEDEKELSKEIIRLSTDKEYCMMQAQKAAARGEYLCDSERVFCDTVKEFLSKCN